MIWRHGLLLTLCLALGALAAFWFSPQPELNSPTWSYTDLRLLDPADASQPTHDLVAVYTRSAPEAVQIRLDMLEHAMVPDYDLYLALDTRPSGSNFLPFDAQADLDWDMLLVIPAAGEMQAVDSLMRPIGEAALRVVRDPVLDQVIISLREAALRKGQSTLPFRAQAANPEASLNLQVFVTRPGSQEAVDRTRPSQTGEPPPPPARVLLAFWDVFPAYTPATALRRWNGAHTGPLGSSHGLLHLLRAAHAEEAPLALLDLKYPVWLSALDFIAGEGLVQQLSREGLLILPDYLPYLGARGEEQVEFLETAAVKLGQAGEDFDLPPSTFRFTQPGYLPVSSEFNMLFVDLTHSEPQPGPLAPTAIGRWRSQRTLPVIRYAGQEAQAQIDGPSLEARRALSQTALAAAQPGGEAAILTLGGDLPASTWGSPAAASASLHYLKSRPWIHLLDAQDLQSAQAAGSPDFEIEKIHPAGSLLIQDNTTMFEALLQAPDNSLAEAAWQAYFALFAPVCPAADELPALRANYLGQVWSLLAAANWAEYPAPIARCGIDPDQDGRPDCVLASEQLYAQFEIESGGLIYLFQRHPAGAAHQLIGPSSQVISGLSDPQSWDLTGGLSADPVVIPGAYHEAGLGYQAALTGDRLTFTTPERGHQKTYVLQANGFRLIYRSARPTSLQIPLLLDPWVRFTPGWSADYQADPSTSGWSVTLEGDTVDPVEVEIRSNAALFLSSFNDTKPFTNRAENPNTDYPSGFYLPFPLTEIGLGVMPGQDTIVDMILKH